MHCGVKDLVLGPSAEMCVYNQVALIALMAYIYNTCTVYGYAYSQICKSMHAGYANLQNHIGYTNLQTHAGYANLQNHVGYTNFHVGYQKYVQPCNYVGYTNLQNHVGYKIFVQTGMDAHMMLWY